MGESGKSWSSRAGVDTELQSQQVEPGGNQRGSGSEEEGNVYLGLPCFKVHMSVWDIYSAAGVKNAEKQAAQDVLSVRLKKKDG